MSFTDSSGVPWEGRSFSKNIFGDDSGQELPKITEAIESFVQNKSSLSDLFASFAETRVLIPLVAKAEETKMGHHGQLVDTSSDMHIVALDGPDGQPSLPIFSSVENLQTWNAESRPVPVQFEKALLAAATEGQTRVVVNPGNENWFAIKRPAIESLAQAKQWLQPEDNPEVKSIVSDAIQQLPIVGYRLVSGDPQSKLIAEELIVILKLEPGMDREQTQSLVAKFISNLDSQRFNLLVDSLKISLSA